MTANPPTTDAPIDADEEARFARYFEKRTADEQRKAARRKEPKDFGELLDRLSDEVCDKLADRFGLVPSDNDDEPPSTGTGHKPNAIAKFFGVNDDD